MEPVSQIARRYPVAAFAAVGMAVGLALMPFAPDASRHVLSAVTIGGGAPLVFETLKNLVRGKIWADLIASLAIVASALLGEFLAGAVVVLMQAGGEALEDYGLRRANRSLDNLLRRAPSVAHVERGGEFVDVPARDVAVGEKLLVRRGGIIPADGVVTEGSAGVDESALTGEPVPLPKLPGDPVYSGTISLSGQLVVRTTRPAAESQYELIVRMVQRAQGERAPINRLANRYAPFFTVVTLAIAGATLFFSREPTFALSVLVVATPCPLIIATPLAVLSAINRAAARNIIVKSGAAIERAGTVRTVVFDKTGTLTVGEPALQQLEVIEPSSTPEEILGEAASVELLSGHGMAAAVVRAARKQHLPVAPASSVEEAPGCGVSGTVDGRRVAVGGAAWIGCAPRPGDDASTACVSVDGEVVGRLVFADTLRPEAGRTIERLHGLGIERTVMLTGDAPEAASRIAGEVGIAEVRARLQPEEKERVVRAIGDHGSVMMVGDGINDAPALAAAGVGVAMGGHGAGIATDAADVVITVEDVERVADVVAIGQRMTRVAKQGIAFGIGGSLVLMGIASQGFIPPALGAVLQECLDLAAILNALRAR